MRGGDDHAQIRPHVAGQERDGGRGQRAGHDDVHAGGAQARREGGLEHVAGQAGILADDHAVLVRAFAEAHPGGQAQTQGHIHGHGIDIDRATQAISAEKTFCHVFSLPVPCAGGYFLRVMVTLSNEGFKMVMPSGSWMRGSAVPFCPGSSAGGTTITSSRLR